MVLVLDCVVSEMVKERDQRKRSSGISEKKVRIDVAFPRWNLLNRENSLQFSSTLS